MTNTLSGLHNKGDKLRFLETALQTGIDENTQHAHVGKQNSNKHMQLVSWALKQIAILCSNKAVHDSISKLNLSHASDQMMNHLNFARRFLAFYPKAEIDQPSPLQKELLSVFENPSGQSIKKANNSFIDQKRENKIHRWNIFTGKNRHLQRAEVLLNPRAIDSFLDSEVQKAITDPILKEVLKEYPYFARARLEGSWANFNCKTFFEGQEDKEIVCRHLATHRIETQARNEKGKFRVDGDKSMFSDLDAVPRLVKADMQLKFKRLCAHAEKNYLIHNADFGKTLIEQFKEMGKQSKQEEFTRYILLNSENHAMSLKLHIKAKPENGMVHRQYVVEFYDPNCTNNHIRFAHTQLNTLHNLGLKDLFATVKKLKTYEQYYPKSREVSMLHVAGTPTQTKEIFNLQVQPNETKSRTLANKIDTNSISPIQISHLMDGGFSGTLKELATDIKAVFTGQALFNLLEAKNANGSPGLYVAMHNGHADAIQAYGKLLEGMPDESRIRLLEAKNANGYPGLRVAMHNGHAEAIKAYGKLLEGLPDESRIRLLEAKSSKGIPALCVALSQGQADAIQAYGKLLEGLPNESRIRLLEAKDNNGYPGLFIASQVGHADAIKAYGKLLEDLPHESRIRLLEAKSPKGNPALCIASYHGQAEAIEAYGTLLQDFSPEQIFTLLAAKDKQGCPGLYMALQNGHADAIQAYGNLLELLPEKEDRIKLFEAKGPGGDLGILKAKSNGYTEAVKAYEQIYERLLRKDHPYKTTHKKP